MPFLKMRLSRFVVGLSLRLVGVLLSTMLPACGYQGSFLGSPPHSEHSEGRSARARRWRDPGDPHHPCPDTDQRPPVALARGDLRVGEHILDPCTSRAVHSVSWCASANDHSLRGQEGASQLPFNSTPQAERP